MSNLLIFATTAISLALVFYTIGVWAEKRARLLKTWHVVCFWFGLVFDAIGTLSMERIAESKSDLANQAATASSIHGITGFLAIALMTFHVLWATRVLMKKDAQKMQTFHRFSFIVWLIWLIPYFVGMYIGMTR